jgi:hypothetical protein
MVKPDSSPDVTTTVLVEPYNYAQYDDDAVLAISGRANIEIENRLTEGDELYELNKNVFYKTRKREPVSSLDRGYLRVYQDKSYIVTSLSIDYVRRPRQISLDLDQSCELAANAPRIIVDGCVTYLKRILENPAYKTMEEDSIIGNQNILNNA